MSTKDSLAKIDAHLAKMNSISEENPIHRLKEVISERIRIARELAPFYAASELLSLDGMADCEQLEGLPFFRENWWKDQSLEQEEQKILMLLGLAYQRSPKAGF